MLADSPGRADRTGLPFPKRNNRGFTGRGLTGRRPRPRTNVRTVICELERERSRIARALHAGAGQPLAAMRLNLETLFECSAAFPLQAREAIARLAKLSEQAIEQVKCLSHSLHAPEWQTLTIADALRDLIESSGLATILAVQMEIEPLAVEPPHATKVTIYRCAQECIANVAQHSGATRVSLGLTTQGSMLELRVEDNGRGFADRNPNTGIGLLALSEHANALGGTCNVSSGPAGSLVVVQLPLRED
jgi:signal transduction histidine kinase